jgi:hypothetical protein
MERKHDNEKSNSRDLSHSSPAPQSLDSHGDLEHTSPTDSRADEKVIVNHRPGLNNSFSSAEDNQRT